uniref:Uncharacterized protein n=1 Tax=Arundo donax TaxID=35708 RepID=A0A0A9HAZ2_ARUDO
MLTSKTLLIWLICNLERERLCCGAVSTCDWGIPYAQQTIIKGIVLALLFGSFNLRAYMLMKKKLSVILNFLWR